VTKDVEKWADEAMFEAEKHENYTEDKGVVPEVTLVTMTHDPLGALAQMCAMYEGRVVRSMIDLTDEDRVRYFKEATATALTTPLEAVTMQFLLEGVDRGLTHQKVRQRVGAAYTQESMRFAVVEDLQHATSLPPSMHGTEPLSQFAGDQYDYANQAQRWRWEYDNIMDTISSVYSKWVAEGMPAEDARSIMPTAVATRINYLCNLRSLTMEAGNRLCTQAQFHWREVFSQMVVAIRKYGHQYDPAHAWQYEMIAESKLFRPICYQQGHCPMKADFDRKCNIRERVDSLAADGIPSTEWQDVEIHGARAVYPGEWLLLPDAAR
jgi:flavin-dependent thymidylate synthase